MSKQKNKSVQKNTIQKYLKKKNDLIYLQLLDQQNHEDNRKETGADEVTLVSQPEAADINLKAEFKLLQKKYSEMKFENEKLLADNKKLTKLLKTAKNTIFYKDLQLQKLSKLSEGTDFSNGTEKSNNIVESIDVATHVKSKRTLFQKYEHSFTEFQLKQMRSVPTGKKKDCTFVTKLMEYLYFGEVGKKFVPSHKIIKNTGKNSNFTR